MTPLAEKISGIKDQRKPMSSRLDGGRREQAKRRTPSKDLATLHLDKDRDFCAYTSCEWTGLGRNCLLRFDARDDLALDPGRTVEFAR